MKKIKKEKEVKETIRKIVSVIIDKRKEREEFFIGEMILCMKTQANIIHRARKDGIEIAELMPRIKKAYDESISNSIK